MREKDMEELKYRLCDELVQFLDKPRWTEKDVQNMYYLAHTKESLSSGEVMDDYSDNGFRSNRSYRRDRSDGIYDNGMTRRHDHYDDYNDRSYRGRSMHDGKEEMAEELEEMMEKASDAETKEAIKKTIAHMKKMNK